MTDPAPPCTAEVVLPAPDLDATLRFFVDALGFRLDEIFPADAPRVAVLCGGGVRVRLDAGRSGDPGTLRLAHESPPHALPASAPNGTRLEWVGVDAPGAAAPSVPPLVPAVVVTGGDDGGWHVGRAGMEYRDLLPGRLGGRFIASHIRVPGAGPVPDYVHHHRVRFQVIFCHRGRVRVVYEDQGPPFWLEPGDLVLQPPDIRHRVLESEHDLEVVEVGCPAEHATRVDRALALPTAEVDPARDFGGQRFVRHASADAGWTPMRAAAPGRSDAAAAATRDASAAFECQSTGVAAATSGLADVRRVRAARAGAGLTFTHSKELSFAFVRSGTATLRIATAVPEDRRVGPGTAFSVPAGVPHALADASDDLEVLLVTLPAD